MAILAGPFTAYSTAQTQPATVAAQTQVSQPADNRVNWSGAGYGAGAVFCSLLYIPFKLTYGILGGLVGGGTYLASSAAGGPLYPSGGPETGTAGGSNIE